jgi:ribosomal protein S18 acetylase RimI-like enzyme
METISIAKLNTVPRVQVASVFASAFDDHHPEAVAAWRGTVRDDLNSGRCNLNGSSLAMERDQPVGAALVYGGVDSVHWRLGALGTVPSRRRGGVGSALIHHLLTVASNASVELVTCEVEVDNTAACRFFENHNFSSEGHLLDFAYQAGPIPSNGLTVRSGTWDQVSRYFTGDRGMRTRAMVSSYADQAGTSVLCIDGRGAAVVRGRCLIDLAVQDDDFGAFQALLHATYGQTAKVIWRHVPESSGAARLALSAGLDVIRTSVSMVHT